MFFIRTFIVEPGGVNGGSMEPHFIDADVFFVNKFILLLRSPQRGDIVQAKHPTDPNKIIIKRVVGVPGDRVVIRQNTVFIENASGELFRLHEPYLAPNTITLTPTNAPLRTDIIQPFHYYVLGDNRSASKDSRDFGPINRTNIYGVITSPLFGRNNN